MEINEKFVIGLGNPGKEYINNRHNIGFLLLDSLTTKHIQYISSSVRPLPALRRKKERKKEKRKKEVV